jgi:hypothetical protein
MSVVNPSRNNATTSTVKIEQDANYIFSRGGIQIKQEIPNQSLTYSDIKPRVTQIGMQPGANSNAHHMIRTIAKPAATLPQIVQDGALSINNVRYVKDPVTGQIKKIITVNRSQIPVQRGSGASSPILTTQSMVISNNGVSSVPIPKPAVVQPLTNKDVSRLWLNDDIKVNKVRGMTPPGGTMMEQVPLEEEVEAEEDELGVSEIYSDYMPTKRKSSWLFLNEICTTVCSVQPDI